MKKIKIYLYDNGIYERSRFNSSIVNELRRMFNDGIGDIIVENVGNTTASEWLADIATRIECDESYKPVNNACAFSFCVFVVSDHGDICKCHDDMFESMLNNALELLNAVHDEATANAVMRDRSRKRLEEHGVIMIDSSNVYADMTVDIAPGVVIHPNVYIYGNTTIGEGSVIHPGCRLTDTKVGKNCTLEFVTARETRILDNVTAGPYVNLRPGTLIESDCRIGDFVEIKNSTIGSGTKVPHLTYVGDADVGERVNIGCGTVFVNYDGKNKHRTHVGNDVFLGCNTNLIAPVNVGNAVYTAAGSTITHDVPDGNLAIARGRQVNKEGWIPPKKREE